MFEFLQKIFGTKSEKDIKALQPKISQIHSVFAELNGVSNDQLRERSQSLKKKIQDYIQADIQKADAIRSRIAENPEMELEEKEKAYAEIDVIEKETLKKIEEVLEEILPEAFAIVKETSRRWKENGQIEVTTSAIEENYLRRHPRASNVVVENGKAIWKNKWMAAGNEISWEMVHYDVQLIGGTVLHSGKKIGRAHV